MLPALINVEEDYSQQRQADGLPYIQPGCPATDSQQRAQHISNQESIHHLRHRYGWHRAAGCNE